MNPTMGFLVAFVAELLVVAQAISAYRNNFFFVWQMREKGFERGVPFACHGGMWGDFFFVSPLIGYIIYAYASKWIPPQILLAGIVGFVASAGLHWMYAKAALASAHNQDSELTLAGWLHLIYMGGAFVILILFYFCTPQISLPFLYFASAMLAVHMFFGTHMVLGFLKPSWFAEEGHNLAGWTTNAVVWTLLIWRCYMIASAQNTTA